MPRLAKDLKEEFYLNENLQKCKRYPGAHSPTIEFVVNLIYTAEVYRKFMNVHAPAEGLSPSALNALSLIRHFGQCKMNELEALLLVSGPSITSLVDSLAKKGLVIRTEDKNDRRAKCLEITPDAEALLERIMPERCKTMRAFTLGLSEQELKSLSNLLMKLRQGAFEFTKEESAKPQKKRLTSRA